MGDRGFDEIMKMRKLKVEGGVSPPRLVQQPAATHVPRTLQAQPHQPSGAGTAAQGRHPAQRPIVGSLGAVGGILPRRESERHAVADLGLQVSELKRRNAELTSQVERYRGLQEGDSGGLRALSQEREMLEEAQERLVALTYSIEAEKGRHHQEERLELETKAAEVERQRSELQAEMERAREHRLESGQPRLAEENDRLKAALAEAEAERDSWRARAELAEDSSQRRASPSAEGRCSESRLRVAMTNHNSTTSELRQAIEATQALLVEANRELASKQLRERRAAFEALHGAMEKDDEAVLEAALAAARLAEVELQDIEKAEAKLEALRSMTDEERQAKIQRALEVKRKKEAFTLVKKDDAQALGALLDALEVEAPGVRWQDWRDYAGRPMLKCARELRASRVQLFLEERLGLAQDDSNKHLQRQHSPGYGRQVSPKLAHATPLEECGVPVMERQVSASSIDRDATAAGAARARARTHSSQDTPAGASWQPHDERPPAGEAAAGAEPAGGAAAASAAAEEPGLGREVPAPPPGEAGQAAAREGADAGAEEEPAEVSPEEEDMFRRQSFRAVVQDDEESLEQMMGRVPSSQWSRWENKAGKDLLTLSQERRSTLAYARLAKALGMVTEMKREAYEERETVWVFLRGEVQPRQATVIEDTPEAADEILIQYWEGDSPPEVVDKCMVRKSLM